jgi:hypothetical protein
MPHRQAFPAVVGYEGNGADTKVIGDCGRVTGKPEVNRYPRRYTRNPVIDPMPMSLHRRSAKFEADGKQWSIRDRI